MRKQRFIVRKELAEKAAKDFGAAPESLASNGGSTVRDPVKAFQEELTSNFLDFLSSLTAEASLGELSDPVVLSESKFTPEYEARLSKTLLPYVFSDTGEPVGKPEDLLDGLAKQFVAWMGENDYFKSPYGYFHIDQGENVLCLAGAPPRAKAKASRRPQTEKPAKV